LPINYVQSWFNTDANKQQSGKFTRRFIKTSYATCHKIWRYVRSSPMTRIWRKRHLLQYFDERAAIKKMKKQYSNRLAIYKFCRHTVGINDMEAKKLEEYLAKSPRALLETSENTFISLGFSVDSTKKMVEAVKFLNTDIRHWVLKGPRTIDEVYYWALFCVGVELRNAKALQNNNIDYYKLAAISRKSLNRMGIHGPFWAFYKDDYKLSKAAIRIYFMVPQAHPPDPQGQGPLIN